MKKKAEVNWYVIGLILALIVLAILIVIFRGQIANVLQNLGILTPNQTLAENVSRCITDPTLPYCQ